MIEDDELLSVVRQWVQKAENDLKNAAYTLMIPPRSPGHLTRARVFAEWAMPVFPLTTAES